ncbi:unnamed protein product [Litomosoides sigmodontis]|uniref:Uncharacterized protein n=1 Tax=Litomosoides sigmodontis TaxID=42156 RepID=A0A3P6U737_LITSI|nr:unnamed protein product [Litomosoides sigmodontis]VDK74024.1 unnamed protein product [Litomosoides sigmodontis]
MFGRLFHLVRKEAMDDEVSIRKNVLSTRDNGKEKIKEIQEREEIVKMWKHIDEKLEMKAKSLNLTAVNVKSILHHMIKNPQVISVIMGLDESSAVADLKLTRSRTKHLSRQETHTNLKEEGVVAVSRASRTFLDVEYDSNEDDDDYLPEQDEDASEGEVENEAGTAEIRPEVLNSTLQVGIDDVAPALHTRSKHESNVYTESVPNFGDDVLLYTAVDDPEYVEFISNLNDPSKYDLDEAEDPEYNFLSDADADDIIEEYELRKDRATEIPLREVENLLQDLLEARLLPLPEHLEQTIDSIKDENKSCELARQDDNKLNIRKSKTLLTNSFPGNVEPTIALVDASLDDFRKVSATSSSVLYSGVGNPPFFSFYELQQLVAQLEKHVQLLTQFAVGCYFDKAMIKIYNAFQVMINELNDYCLERPEHSLFNVANLEACIATCHDVIECETVSDFIIHRQKPRKLEFPLPKAMLVLSRSKALVFPELLPQVRMKVFPSFYPYFIREEECLLALGLYQFAHLKQFSGKRKCYALINQHLLANKTQSQIRLHLKNFRSSNQPIHTLFVKAETGTVNMIFPLENRSTAIPGPPYLWPQHLQPRWLKELVDRQQDNLDCESLVLDGLTFAKITNEKNSPLVNRADRDRSSLLNNQPECRTVDDTENWAADVDVTSAPINEPINTALASANSGLHQSIIMSPARSSLISQSLKSVERSILPSPNSCSLIAALPSCEKQQSAVSPHPRIVLPNSGESPAVFSKFPTVTPSISESTDFIRNNSAIKPVRLAPFKKIPPTENECEENLDSDQNEIEMVDETDESTGSSVCASGEVLLDSSPSPDCKNSTCLQQSSERIEHDSSDGALSHSNATDFVYVWPVEADKHENFQMKYTISPCSATVEKIKEICDVSEGGGHRGYEGTRNINQKSSHSPCYDAEVSYDMPECSSLIYKSLKWVPNTPNGDVEYSDLVSWTPRSSSYYGGLMMFGTENKAVQCDLTASIRGSEVTQILGNTKDNKLTQNISRDSSANSIRVFEPVHCGDPSFAQDNEQVGEAEQEQNEQTVSNDGGRSSESGRDEQQQPTGDVTDGNKASLPGDREGDGGDGEGNGPIDEEKRRRRARSRKDRVRDGLHGMLDAQHRALQIKCMAHVIFNDFEQRMFMYQDKVRALCELVAEGSMSPEMFERMHDIFEEEHEPIYFLLSFLFPQNLVPASVLENPIRKAYNDAFEMMYNIEAFTFFGNTRLSARTIFRNVRDLGKKGSDCTCEVLTARLFELIGNKSPLWEIISQNIPTRLCQSNYSVTDFEYVDLCSWKKVDAPFESVDLTTAIGAQTEKQRSGVFVGFLRNLFTERKGKLYEVVAEWKQTKITPESPRRRLPGGRTKKRKYKISNKDEIAKLPETSVKVLDISDPSLQERTADVLSISAPRESATALQCVRKRPILPKVAEMKKRKKCEDILVKQDIFNGNNNSLVGTNYIAHSDANLYGSSGGGADTSLGNVAESRIVEAGLADNSLCKVGSGEGFVECKMRWPIMMNTSRKWTIEEDRKILYIHKENGSDLDLTLAAVQLELPEIPIDELRQRLVFLLNLLQCMEDTGSKQKNPHPIVFQEKQHDLVLKSGLLGSPNYFLLSKTVILDVSKISTAVT